MNMKVQVRSNGDYFEAFWREDNETGCFSFEEGHNVCSEAYRLKDCKPVPKEAAERFKNAMQRYYDSIPGENIELVLVSKLKR